MSKVVLVTGGSIGIGRAICLRFAKSGYNVVFSYYKDAEEAERVKRDCIDLGAKSVFFYYLNLVDDNSIKKFVAEVIGRYSRIDILVNNAGVIAWKKLEDQTFDEIALQVRVNLEGLIKITKILLPYVKDKIINISSGAGKTGFSELTTYCATKFGVRGFTQAIAKELHNIKVISVNPDMTQTRMTNFVGRPPEDVAEIVFKVAENIINVSSGDDVDVWKFA
ncbi:MAG: SDR family oxidoreductase [Brevinematales bacterium]|nr:SDR family oxidoreductase [Brevinematales bacterium]